MQYIYLHFLNNVFSCLGASYLYMDKLHLIVFLVLNGSFMYKNK